MMMVLDIFYLLGSVLLGFFYLLFEFEIISIYNRCVYIHILVLLLDLGKINMSPARKKLWLLGWWRDQQVKNP